MQYIASWGKTVRLGSTKKEEIFFFIQLQWEPGRKVKELKETGGILTILM